MDPFATLGIERKFDVDLGAVEKTHRELSRALHPDRFAAAGASERRLSLSKAVEVNESWRIVRDPIRRAEALFALAGVPVGENREPKPSGELLMDMLEQREALADAKERRDLGAVRGLAEAIASREEAARRELASGFAKAAGDSRELGSLVPKLGELRFYRRFLDEVSAIEDEITEGAHALLRGEG
jgi:molecular chaperone HscB